MGKEKYVKDVEELFKKSPVITASSISKLIKSKGKVKQYNRQFIRNLIQKGKIKKLAKGCYTIHEDPTLAVFCYKPSYLGLQDALSFHEVWEQETTPIIITATKKRQGIKEILGMNVYIRRINRKYLFGFDYHEQGKFYLPYSDLEKTFIDMIYFKEKINPEAKKNMITMINNKKLMSYLKVYPLRFRKRVLNYLQRKD